MQTIFYSLSIVLTLLCFIQAHGQISSRSGKAHIEHGLSLKMVNHVLAQSAEQYKLMMKSLPDTAFPRTYENGVLKTAVSPSWVIGFYPGTLLLLYQNSHDKILLAEAEKKLHVLEKDQYDKGTHDLGFMMYCSFGTAEKISKRPYYERTLLNSAKSLKTRFSPKVGAVRSWDHSPEKWKYPVIIDNMMNLEILCWASKFSGDSSFLKVAISHADKTLKNHFRADYSSYHVVDYDPETGEVLKKLTEQGYGNESAWARGQAWGLYGFTMMYRETGDKKYLQQAIKIAHFILSNKNMPADLVPYWDFNAPDIPNAKRDASAAAIISSGLIELSGYVSQGLKSQYLNSAERILRSLSSAQYSAKVGENDGFILKHSVGFLPINSEVDVPLSYADYYYIEALMRYKKLATQHTLFKIK